MKTEQSSEGKPAMAFIGKTSILTAAFMFAWVSCSAMPGAAELPTNAMGAPQSIRTAMEPKVASAGPECTKPGSMGGECPHANDRFVTSPSKPPEQVALPKPPAMKVVPGLEEPLVAIGYVSEEESKDLDAATTAFREAPKTAARDADFADFAKPLIGFIDSHPKSSWNVAILTNLGLGYYHAGYFSKAFTSWQAAWDQGRNATSTPAKLLVDRTVAELIRMHARVGHAKELDALFKDIGDRPIGGSATEMIQGAKEGLWHFKNKPEISYLCGPRALRNVLEALKGDKKQIDIADDAKSGPHGFSLSQLDELATKAKLKHILIHREPGQPIPVPSIVHWNVHHYAAIMAYHDGLYEVRDPTFGSPTGQLLSAKAIDAESSGYFLVPEKTASAEADAGWKGVKGGSAEAKSIYGMGYFTSYEAGMMMWDDIIKMFRNGWKNFFGTADPTCCTGMAAAAVHPQSLSLTLIDTPVGYQTQKGPSPITTVVYNAREDQQPANFSFSNMSAKWSFNWMSYVVDDPAFIGNSVKRIGGGGGGYIYTNSYNSGTGMFNYPEEQTYSFLWRIPATGTATSYELRHMDGSKEVYGLPDGAATYPRKMFLTSMVDAQGNTLTVNYDGTFRITSLLDAMGRSTTFSYGLVSYPLLITQITDPFTRSASFTYDTSQRLASITDPQGITSSFGYQPGEPSFVGTLTTPYGTSKFSDRVNLYDPNAALTRSLTLTDPLGFTEFHYLYPNQNLVPASDPANTLPAGMDTGDNFRQSDRNTFYWGKHQFPLGVTTDACNNPLKEDVSKAYIMHWLMQFGDVMGRALSSYKAPLENRVWMNYQGQLSSVVVGTLDLPTFTGRVLDDGTTQKSAATYNPMGLPLTKTDSRTPSGRVTRFTYFANDIDLQKVEQLTTSPFTYTTIATYPTYNAQHEPLSYTGPDNKTWNYTYTAAGQIKTVTDPNSGVTTWNYDTSDRLSTIQNANLQTALTLTYDAQDRVQTRTDSEGYVLTYEYNNINQVTKITYPDATTDLFDYTFQSGPSIGLPTLDLRKYTDRLGRVTTYDYDGDERLISVTEPLAGATTRTTTYDYYEDGTLKNITDANSNVTHWEIDLQSRPISKTYAFGTTSAKTETYTYENKTSRLKSITDALGQVKTFSYDNHNNIIGIAYTNTVNPTPNVTFAYDTYFPRRTSMTDGTGTTNYSYTPLSPPTNGALKLSSIAGPYTNDTLGLTYDALGRLASETISGGNESFGYDAISRMNSHTTPLGAFTNTYLGQTNQIASRTVTNGATTVSTAWGYDTNANDRRLISIANSGVTRSFTLGYGTTPVNPYDIMSITDTAATTHPWATQSHDYTYDDSDRLLTASYTTPGNFAFAYDPLDNPTTWTTPIGTTSPTYNGLNQINTWGALTYAYDADGNLTSGDGVKSYRWDAANRLIEIDYASGPISKSQFTYDGLGHRRIDVETPAVGSPTTTRYMWCGGFICQAREGGTTGTDTVLRRQMAEGEYVVSGTQKLVYMPDQLGAVRDVLDATTGTRVQSYDYEPYGGIARSDGSTGTDYQFAELFSHPNSTLNLSSTRPYDPATGRWLNKDSIREAGGINLMAYGGANPISRFDPWGLLTVHEWDYRGSKDSWGHASTTLDNNTHISWWPDGAHSGSLLKVHIPIYSANANTDQQLEDDIQGEDDIKPFDIKIEGLDEGAIQQWWDKFRADKENKWTTLGQNCSQTTADALGAGGGVKWAILGGYLPFHPIAWDPSNVKDYANAINKGMDRWNRAKAWVKSW